MRASPWWRVGVLVVLLALVSHANAASPVVFATDASVVGEEPDCSPCYEPPCDEQCDPDDFRCQFNCARSQGLCEAVCRSNAW